jgi:hypothetical protein
MGWDVAPVKFPDSCVLVLVPRYAAKSEMVRYLSSDVLFENGRLGYKILIPVNLNIQITSHIAITATTM